MQVARIVSLPLSSLAPPARRWGWRQAGFARRVAVHHARMPLHQAAAGMAKIRGSGPEITSAQAQGEAGLAPEDRVLLEVLRDTLAEQDLTAEDRKTVETAIRETLQGRGRQALQAIEASVSDSVPGAPLANASKILPEQMDGEQTRYSRAPLTAWFDFAANLHYTILYTRV
jgi:hypothetical protein